MFNLIHYQRFNSYVILAILFTFPITYSLPLPAQMEYVNDVAFMIRLEKLVDKLVKSNKKSNDKIIENFIDVKHEIENSYNTNIDLDAYLKQTIEKINKAGYGEKISKKQASLIRNKMKKADKKRQAHTTYIASVINIEGYSLYDEHMMFFDRKSDKKNEQDKEEEELPSQLVIGISIALSGFFITLIPIPICKEWGPRLVTMGLSACINPIATKNDEKKKE